jgi:transcriptional regulator GlxA family with amidase domain
MIEILNRGRSMDRRIFLSAGAGALFSTAGACAADPRVSYAAQPVSAEERARTIAAMKPPKRAKPVVAVLCDNMGSETTDTIIPWSILTRSGVADTKMVSTEAGPVTLHPALRLTAQATVADFEAAHPDGPDYVIVPAYHHRESARAIDWIKRTSAGGATIVSICAGALTVGLAGLFEGREGTTHWYSVEDLRKISPGMTWRQDRRYVADRGVVSTTGVSASIPVSLALVEAIAGRTRADALASDLGVASYDERHDSQAFQDARGFIGRGAINSANVLGKETHAIRAAPGIDELTLAVTADAWSRTYRSTCVTLGESTSIQTRHGLDLLVDRVGSTDGLRLIEALPANPGEGIDAALSAIATRYGDPTAAFVALQLEHPWTADVG